MGGMAHHPTWRAVDHRFSRRKHPVPSSQLMPEEKQQFPQQARGACALGPTLGQPQIWCELRDAGPCLGGSRGCSFEDVVSRPHFESDATFLFPSLGCYSLRAS